MRKYTCLHFSTLPGDEGNKELCARETHNLFFIDSGLKINIPNLNFIEHYLKKGWVPNKEFLDSILQGGKIGVYDATGVLAEEDQGFLNYVDPQGRVRKNGANSFLQYADTRQKPNDGITTKKLYPLANVILPEAMRDRIYTGPEDLRAETVESLLQPAQMNGLPEEIKCEFLQRIKTLVDKSREVRVQPSELYCDQAPEAAYVNLDPSPLLSKVAEIDFADNNKEFGKIEERKLLAAINQKIANAASESTKNMVVCGYTALSAENEETALNQILITGIPSNRLEKIKDNFTPKGAEGLVDTQSNAVVIRSETLSLKDLLSGFNELLVEKPHILDAIMKDTEIRI